MTEAYAVLHEAEAQGEPHTSRFTRADLENSSEIISVHVLAERDSLTVTLVKMHWPGMEGSWDASQHKAFGNLLDQSVCGYFPANTEEANANYNLNT